MDGIWGWGTWPRASCIEMAVSLHLWGFSFVIVVDVLSSVVELTCRKFS